MAELLGDEGEVEDVGCAVAVDVGGIFDFMAHLAVKIGESVGFCFNKTPTEPQLLDRLNPILIYINQLVIHYQRFNLRPNTA